MKYCFLLLLVFLISSCDESPENEATPTHQTTDSTQHDTPVIDEVAVQDEVATQDETPAQDETILLKDVFNMCENMSFYEGSIQGSGDHSKIFVMGECIAGEASFDAIFVPKEQPRDNAWDRFDKNDWDNTFTGYLFFIGQEVNPNPENEFDQFRYIFPAEVKVYASDAQDEWRLLGRHDVATFEELGALKHAIVDEK